MRITRRNFIGQTSALLTASAFAAPAILRAQDVNSKLNVASIGVGGMGDYSVNGVKRENYLAMCDVDGARAKKNFEAFPNAKKFTDFRKLLDEFGSKLDAVTVSTPDHIHAAAAVAAMNRGINVYCEKPLGHDVGEVRKMIEIANAKKLKTHELKSENTSSYKHTLFQKRDDSR